MISRFKDFTVSQWAGGQTTQLFIYPPKANYAARDFDFRLSTATVELEKSDFTALPGFHRKLMILEGEIVISHENHQSKTLQKFDIESFEGEWKTSSVGQCTDFNVMTSPKHSSTLKAISLETNEELTLEKCDWHFVYVLKGRVKITQNKSAKILCKGDLLVLEKQAQLLQSEENCTVILVEIFTLN